MGFKLKQKTKWFNAISGWVTKQELLNIAELQVVKKLDIVHKFKNDYSIEQEDSPPEINQNQKQLNKIIQGGKCYEQDRASQRRK